MERWVFNHAWLTDQLPEIHNVSAFTGADDFRTSRLVWYLRLLQWASVLIKANPHIKVATVSADAGGAHIPNDLETFEALAVEWFLLGLVELPPCGVQLR